MRLALALGVAAAALTFSAYAQTHEQPREEHRIIMHGPGGGPGMMGHDMMGDMDANHDGWLSRDEAAAAADRIFAHMDADHDGKLDQADHEAMRASFESHTEADGHGGTIVRMGDDHEVHIEHGDNREVHVETLPGGGETRTIIITRGGDGEEHTETHTEHGASSHAEHHSSGDHQTVERNVTIVRTGDGEGGEHGDHPGPHGTMMAHAPMFMMMFSNSEEADANGDNALSQEEFRNQHLRFFDASDANRDGKIRMHMPLLDAPPAPPAPPASPAPPAPPRRR